VLALFAQPAGAEVFLSKQEALAQAFPQAERVESESLVLGDAEAKAIEQISGGPLESRLVTVYRGVRGGETQGYAFIEMHTVRTLPEAFLVVLSPAGEVRSVRMLAFYEPNEFLPSERWLAQFDGRALSPELRLGGAIHGIAGSSLSSRAVTMGVRRTLALFDLVVRHAPPDVALQRAAGGVAAGAGSQ
jgi:hypothetical protein